MLDRYTHSSLVYYKHNGDDEPHDRISSYRNNRGYVFSLNVDNAWKTIPCVLHAAGRQPCQRTRSLYHTPRYCCRDQIRSSPNISDYTWNKLWPRGLGHFHFRYFLHKNKIKATSLHSYTECCISYFNLTDRTCLYRVFRKKVMNVTLTLKAEVTGGSQTP